jgi:hypothetical protein
MRQTLSAEVIRERNGRDDSAVRGPEDVHWRRFSQMRPFLYSLERVCGTEKEIDAMAHSGSRRGRPSWILVHAVWVSAILLHLV